MTIIENWAIHVYPKLDDNHRKHTHCKSDSFAIFYQNYA